jgi:hypothetical protein
MMLSAIYKRYNCVFWLQLISASGAVVISMISTILWLTAMFYQLLVKMNMTLYLGSVKECKILICHVTMHC